VALKESMREQRGFGIKGNAPIPRLHNSGTLRFGGTATDDDTQLTYASPAGPTDEFLRESLEFAVFPLNEPIQASLSAIDAVSSGDRLRCIGSGMMGFPPGFRIH
jgi:hypothetical protein